MALCGAQVGPLGTSVQCLNSTDGVGLVAGIYVVRNPAQADAPGGVAQADALSGETSLVHQRICVPSERPAAVSL
jgi:hypothetical protein